MGGRPATASAPSASARNTSAPVRTPLSKSTGRSSADGVDDAGEGVERADRAIDLASRVIGHHDAVDAGVERLAGVIGMLDPLEHDRQLRALPQEVEVRPGQARAREHVEEGLDGDPRFAGAEVGAGSARGSRRVMPSSVRTAVGVTRGFSGGGVRAVGSRRDRLGDERLEHRIAGVLRDAHAADERQVRAVEVAGTPAEHLGVERDDDRLRRRSAPRGRRSSRPARRRCSSRAGTRAGRRPPRPRRAPWASTPGWRGSPGCRARPPPARSRGRHPDPRARGRRPARRAAEWGSRGRRARRRGRATETSRSTRGTIRQRVEGVGVASAVDSVPLDPCHVGPGLRRHRALGDGDELVPASRDARLAPGCAVPVDGRLRPASDPGGEVHVRHAAP